MKLGLKLWSTNTQHINSAIALFKKKVYNFIELFIVPDSYKFIEIWKELRIPLILHAPHSYAGLNMSMKCQERKNLELIKCVKCYVENLTPKFVIFHPGISGTIQETIRQLINARNAFQELMSLGIIENKPKIGLKREPCVGYSFEEISQIIECTKMGFCLDFGHAICAANGMQIDPIKLIDNFLSLKPVMFHLSDGHHDSQIDEHLNFGKGNFDLKTLISKIDNESLVSIETKKSSSENLDDFESDVQYLRRILNDGNSN